MTQVISQRETLPCVMVPTERRVCRKSKSFVGSFVGWLYVKGSQWKFRRKFRRKFGGISEEIRWKFGGSFGGSFGGRDVVFQAYYSPLLVLVCRSVSQDPPRPIEDITVAFGLLYSPSTALSQSAVSYAHAAPGRPISDRLSPDTAVLSAVPSFALRKYLLIN